jgi:hypothetical protein
MNRWILRLKVATIAFGLGVVVHQLFVFRKAPMVQPVQRCDPARIEVKTVFVPPAAPPPLEIFDFDSKSPPPSGTFYLSKTPKGFEDIEFVNFWWWDPRDEDESKGKGTINVQANGGSDKQRTVVSLITRRRVLLITESESGKGFGYRFDGEFVPNKNLEALADAGKPIIRGTLTKTKNGKKVAESSVSLYLLVEGHC